MKKYFFALELGLGLGLWFEFDFDLNLVLFAKYNQSDWFTGILVSEIEVPLPAL